MKLFNSLICLPSRLRRQKPEFLKKTPFEIQEKVFFNLIRKAKKTKWGKLYNYSAIRSIEDFRRQVPLQRYEDLQVYIERMKTGEKNILWPGKIKKFACSSGTTGAKSKFIPVSLESLKDCHYKVGKSVGMAYLEYNNDSSLLTGKTLTLGGSQKKNEDNLYVGDLSAILMNNLPLWTYFSRTPDLNIALLGEWEEKLEKIVEASRYQNVTCLAGVPSWMLVLLRRLLEKTGKDNILDIWPNLELFIHGGISFSPYREQFKKLIPSDKMKYLEVYNASEGFFAHSEKPGDEDMLLMLDCGVFYEFIPMDEFGKDSPQALGLKDVEIGKNYALIISTNGGLWRYIIGDTVIFTSISPYKIKISGRTKHFINAFGEELMVSNADQALEEACLKTGAAISDYTAGPIFMNENRNGGHEWLIEFSREPDDFMRFCSILDNTLKSLNSDYEAKRYKDIALSPPRVVKVRSGLFNDWLKNKNKLGGQNKVPRLANSREYLEELTKLF